MQNSSQKCSDISIEKSGVSLSSYTIGSSKEFMKEMLSFDYNESNYRNMLTSFESVLLSQERQYESKILDMSQTITSLQQEILILTEALAQKDKEISNFQNSKELLEAPTRNKRSLLNRSAVSENNNSSFIHSGTNKKQKFEMEWSEIKKKNKTLYSQVKKKVDTNLQKRESVVRKHGYAVITKKEESAIEKISLPKKESTLHRLNTSDSGWEVRWEKKWKENDFKEIEESQNLLNEIEKAVKMGNYDKCSKKKTNDTPLVLFSSSQIKEEISDLDKIMMNLNKNHITLEKKIKKLVKERNFFKDMNGDLANNILNQQKIINDYESLLKASYSYSKESTNINYDLSSLFQKLININGCSKDIILTVEDFFKKLNFQPNIDKLNIILLGLKHNFKEKLERNIFFKIKKTPSVKYSPKFPTPDDESNKENVNTNNRDNEDMYQSKNIKSPLKNIRSVSEFKQNSAESLFEKNLLTNEELDKKFLILTEEKARLQNEVDFLKKSQELKKNQTVFNCGDIKYRNTVKKSQDLIQFMNKLEKKNGSFRDFFNENHESPENENVNDKDDEFANVVLEENFIDLEKKLTQLQNDCESLNIQINQKEMEKTSLKQENDDLINQINSLQKEILMLNEKNQQIFENFNELQKKYDALLENNQLSLDKIQKNDDYEQKYNSIFEECSQMKEEIKYWQNYSLQKENSEIYEKNSRNEQLENEYNNLNSKYEDMQKQYEEMEKEFEAMKNAQEIMLNLVRSKEERIQDLNKKYEFLNENFKIVQFANVENNKKNEEENLLSELEVLKKFDYFEKTNEKPAHKEVNEKECQVYANRLIEKMSEKEVQTESNGCLSQQNNQNHEEKKHFIIENESNEDLKNEKSIIFDKSTEQEEKNKSQYHKNIKILETNEIGVQYEITEIEENLDYEEKHHLKIVQILMYENNKESLDYKINVSLETSEKETQYEGADIIEECQNNKQKNEYEIKFNELLNSYKTLEGEKLAIEQNLCNLNMSFSQIRQNKEKIKKSHLEEGVQSELEIYIEENEKKNNEIFEKYNLLESENKLLEKKLAELEINSRNSQNSEKEVQTELQEKEIVLMEEELKEKEKKYHELLEQYHFLEKEKKLIEKNLTELKKEQENLEKNLNIHEDYEKNLAYVEELNQKIQILQKDHEKILNKNQILDNEKLLLEESLNNLKNVTHEELEIKNKAISCLESDINQLKTEFYEQKEKFDKIQHILKNKINDYEELYEKYMRLREENNEIRQVKSYQVEFDEQKKKFDQIEHILKNKINDYEELYEKYMRLREENNEIRQLKSYQVEFDEQKKKFDQIQHILKNKINDYEELYEKYMKLREENNEIRKQLVNTQKNHLDLLENCKKIEENKDMETNKYMTKVAFLEIKVILQANNLRNIYKQNEKLREIMNKTSLENSRLASENSCLSRQIESFQKTIYKNTNVNKENINMNYASLPPTNKLMNLKNDWEHQLNLLLNDEINPSSSLKTFVPLIFENNIQNSQNNEICSNLNDIDFLMKKIKKDHENSKNTIKKFYETILLNLVALFCFFVENILQNQPFFNIDLDFLLKEKKIVSNPIINSKIKELNRLFECFSDYQNIVASNEVAFLNKFAPKVSTDMRKNMKVFSIKYQNFKNNFILSKIM